MHPVRCAVRESRFPKFFDGCVKHITERTEAIDKLMRYGICIYARNGIEEQQLEKLVIFERIEAIFLRSIPKPLPVAAVNLS